MQSSHLLENDINISQERLVPVLNRFLKNSIFKSSNIVLNKDGICAALVVKYLIKKAKGDEQQFFYSNQKIVRLRRKEYQNFEIKEWMSTYIRDVNYAFNPGSFETDIKQGDLDKIYQKIYPSQEDGFIETLRTSVMLDVAKIEDFLTLITTNENEYIYFAGNKHAVGISKKSNTYFLYDPNHTNGEVSFTSLKDLSKHLLKAVFVEPSDRHLIIEVKSFQYLADKNLDPNRRNLYIPKNDIIDMISANDTGYHQSLLSAAQIGDIEMVSNLLEKGADPFITNPNKSKLYDYNKNTLNIACAFGRDFIIAKILNSKHSEKITPDIFISALNQSILFNQITAINLLLAHAKQNNMDHIVTKAISALFISASTIGSLEILIILKKYDIYNQTTTAATLERALNSAAFEGKPKTLNYIIELSRENNIHLNFSMAISNAIMSGHYGCFSILTKQHPVTTNHLSEAINSKQLRMVSELLQSEITINLSHVRQAINHYDLDMLTILLSDESKYSPTDYNRHGNHLLKLIKNILLGDKESYRQLSELINDKSFYQKILLMAIINCNDEIISNLEKLDISIDSTDEVALEYFATACAENDIELVALMIKSGIDCHVPIKVGPYKDMTAFQVAALLSPEISIWILQNRQYFKLPLPLPELYSAMEIACQAGHLSLVKELTNHIDYNDEINKLKPLEIAAKTNHPKIIKYLLEKGADHTLTKNNGKDFLLKICIKGKLNLIKLCLASKPDASRQVITLAEVENNIIKAAKRNHATAISCFMEIHTPRIEKINEAIEEAWKARHIKSVNILLMHASENGLDVTLPTQNVIQFLHELYKDLLDKPQQKIEEYLELAEIHNHTGVISYIKSHKSNALSQCFFSFDGLTALIKACLNGDLARIKLLTEIKNVKYDIVNNPVGQNPLSVAACSGHKEVVDYFLKTLTKPQRDQILISAADKKIGYLVVAILENMKPSELTPDLIEELKKISNDIHSAWQNILLVTPNSNTLREDAKQRQWDVTNNKNALGIFVNQIKPNTTGFSKK